MWHHLDYLFAPAGKRLMIFMEVKDLAACGRGWSECEWVVGVAYEFVYDFR